MSEISAPVFIRMLRNLRGLLVKAQDYAASNNIQPEVLASARLFPNMLALSNQVQIACDTAKRGLARLSGIEAPSHPDSEKTLEELIVRIDSTLEFLQSIPAEAIDGSETKAIKLELPNLTLDFVGAQYLSSFALPNFFFHVSTAHAILRHNGVPIGKMDFLGAPSRS